MGLDWITDRDWACKMMRKIVFPAMVREGFLEPGRPIKDEVDELLTELDKDAGIDYIWRTYEGNLISISARVQDSDKNYYESLTVRKARSTGAKTEYDKRIVALAGGYIMAKKVTQAYVSKKTNKLEFMCMMALEELVKYIRDGKEGLDYEVNINRRDGNEFYIIFCSTLILRGYSVNCYRNKNRY